MRVTRHRNILMLLIFWLFDYRQNPVKSCKKINNYPFFKKKTERKEGLFCLSCLSFAFWLCSFPSKQNSDPSFLHPVPPPSWTRPQDTWTPSLLRTMASDFEVLILIPAASHWRSQADGTTRTVSSANSSNATQIKMVIKLDLFLGITNWVNIKRRHYKLVVRFA